MSRPGWAINSATIERERLRAAMKMSIFGLGAFAHLSARGRWRAFWIAVGAMVALGTVLVLAKSAADFEGLAGTVFVAFVLFLYMFAYDTILAYVLLERRDRAYELDTAARIQQALFPASLPCEAGCTAAAHHAAAAGLSGDYHDVIAMPSGRWLLVVADVAGKGIPAAILMSGLRTRLRMLAETIEDPAELVQRLNTGMAADSTACEYATVFLAVANPAAGTLAWVDAGHQPGLLVRGDGSFTRLDGTDLPVGMFPEASFTAQIDVISPGDRLVLFTDGVLDASIDRNRDTTPEQLAAAIVAHPDATAGGAVEAARTLVNLITGGAPGDDDITVLAVRF